MLLFWKIRFLDTRDRQFKDRSLWLDTDQLDPVAKAAVEATYDLKISGRDREMLRFRALFGENRPGASSPESAPSFGGGFCLPDYFEDENCEELSLQRMAVALTGNPNAVMFPPGTPKGYIEFCMAEKPDIDLDQLTVSENDLFALGCFSRDIKELQATALWHEGPGSLSGCGNDNWRLRTAVNDEEVRSFVTIFRRLYMASEPGNFVKAATVFSECLVSHPVAKWMKCNLDDYQAGLETPPGFALPNMHAELSFTGSSLWNDPIGELNHLTGYEQTYWIH